MLTQVNLGNDRQKHFDFDVDISYNPSNVGSEGTLEVKDKLIILKNIDKLLWKLVNEWM